jgi:hypothetical protein
LACCGICVPSNAEHAASRFRGMRRAKGSHTQYWLGVAGLQPAFGGAVLGRKLGRRDNATAREHMMAGRVQLRHGRAATPPAVAARSSKMPKSSAPEFRIKDGSRLHSGECAQSVDVLIPARRRGTRSRTYAHRPSCRRWRLAGLASDLPGIQDPRCYLVNSCMAEPKTFDAKSIRRSHTGSRTEHAEPWLNKAGLWAIPAR